MEPSNQCNTPKCLSSVAFCLRSIDIPEPRCGDRRPSCCTPSRPRSVGSLADVGTVGTDEPRLNTTMLRDFLGGVDARQLSRPDAATWPIPGNRPAARLCESQRVGVRVASPML
jgi:hypothetical protein